MNVRALLAPTLLLALAAPSFGRPPEVDDLLAQADRHYQEGKLDDARAAYDRAIELEPKRGEAWIGRARVRLAKKDLPGARTDLDQAVALLPQEGLAQFERGRVRFAQGDVQGAIEDYGVAIERQKDPLRAWVARGWARLTIGDFDGAIADCDAAAKLDPDDPHVFKNRARARFEKNELEGALADLDHALDINADDLAARVARAIVRTRSGDVKGALADCEAAVALAPEDAQARYTVGSLRALLGERAAALADYEVALKLKGGAPQRTLNNRALLRAQAGELALALADLDAVIAKEPSASACSNRGWVLALQGDHEAAVAAYTRAIELDPRGAAFAYRGRAFARALAKNDPAAALEDLREAAHRTLAERRVSSNWSVRSTDWDRMASRLVLKQEEYGEADLLEVARLDALPALRAERLGRSHGLLGLLAELDGKKDAAQEHYRQAVAQEQDHLLEVRWARSRLPK